VTDSATTTTRFDLNACLTAKVAANSGGFRDYTRTHTHTHTHTCTHTRTHARTHTQGRVTMTTQRSKNGSLYIVMNLWISVDTYDLWLCIILLECITTVGCLTVGSGLELRIRISSSAWLVSGYSHVFVYYFLLSLPLSRHTHTLQYADIHCFLPLPQKWDNLGNTRA